MKRGLVNRSLLLILLLASVLGMVVASPTSSINLPIIMASTDGGEGGGGGGGDDSGENNDPEPEPEPEPDPEPEPIVSEPIIPEPEPTIDCPEGTVMNEAGDACISEEPTDTTAALLPTDKEVLPYCDLVGDDYQGSCHDRLDIDEITGLYPCNDGKQQVDWRDCPDATQSQEPGGAYCQALGCPGSPPDPVKGCFDGRDPVEGKCPIPEPEPECPPGWDLKGEECTKDITIIITKIVNTVKDKNKRGHGNFPDVDIIGLSTKQSGDSIICLMNIDNGWVQCQEFGMDPRRVNSDFWRIIEVNQDKDYDNGGTGSNNVDQAIDDIKNHDFDSLDDDRENHDFNINLAWIAINPAGEGVVCLSQDSTGKGKSLCEPFKVSSQDVSGQITEGVQIG